MDLGSISREPRQICDGKEEVSGRVHMAIHRRSDILKPSSARTL
jgi:hypothetical protein